MSDKSLEARVDTAISHLLSVIDRRGLDNVSKETLERYSTGALGDALNSLSGVSSLNKGNSSGFPV